MTVMDQTAPVRSRAQRLAALTEANRVRSAHAEIKRDLKTGRRRIVDVLADPPAELGTAKVVDVLLAVPKVGRVKANKALVGCRISPSKTLGGLTVRQRDELAGRFR